MGKIYQQFIWLDFRNDKIKTSSPTTEVYGWHLGRCWYQPHLQLHHVLLHHSNTDTIAHLFTSGTLSASIAKSCSILHSCSITPITAVRAPTFYSHLQIIQESWRIKWRSTRRNLGRGGTSFNTKIFYCFGARVCSSSQPCARTLGVTSKAWIWLLQAQRNSPQISGSSHQEEGCECKSIYARNEDFIPVMNEKINSATAKLSLYTAQSCAHEDYLDARSINFVTRLL